MERGCFLNETLLREYASDLVRDWLYRNCSHSSRDSSADENERNERGAAAAKHNSRCQSSILSITRDDTTHSIMWCLCNELRLT